MSKGTFIHRIIIMNVFFFLFFNALITMFSYQLRLFLTKKPKRGVTFNEWTIGTIEYVHVKK